MAISKTYRVRDIPESYDQSELQKALQAALPGYRVYIESLATDINLATFQKSRTATVAFESEKAVAVEELLQSSGSRFLISLPQTGPSSSPVKIVLDSDFLGFTPLSPCENDRQHQIICIAVHGWGGNAFGSFFSNEDRHMWLRDALPKSFSQLQVWTYGYGSALNSSHIENPSAYAARFAEALQDLLSVRFMPLVFVAHSLGGLVLKEAIISLASASPDIIESIKSILFFGVPTQGMKTEALEGLVGNQPHRYNLTYLDDSTGHEDRLQRHEAFCSAFDSDQAIVYQFYETVPTRTPEKDPKTDKWKNTGPPVLMVSHDSAISGRWWERDGRFVLPLPADHRSMVKFTCADREGLHRVWKCFRATMNSKSKEQDSASRNFTSTLTSRIKGLDISRSGTTSSAISHYDYEACIDSFWFSESNARQASIESAMRNTCEWLFDTPEYQTWWSGINRDDHHGLFWIKGKPGAGKSTIVKTALHQARQKIERNGGGILIATHFFNARGTELERTSLGLFLSLIHQLLQQDKTLCDLVLPSFKLKRAPVKWHVEELKDILRAIVVSRHLLFFIDALDECHEIQVRNAIDFFVQLGEESLETEFDLRACFSSRHYPYISVPYSVELIVEHQNDHTADISKYVRGHLRSRSKDAVLAAVQEKIIERARGVFLWVVLVVRRLKPEHDRGQTARMEEILETIPEDLDEFFKELLTRNGIVSDQTVLLFQWLLFSLRPLSPIELFCAVHAGDNPIMNEKDEEVVEKFILDCSRGLVEVPKTEHSLRVQFIHETVRDFFLLHGGFQTLNAVSSGSTVSAGHDRLKTCCLNYTLAVKGRLALASRHALWAYNWEVNDRLSSSQFDPRRVANTKVRAVFVRDQPFIEYAATNTLLHADAAQKAGLSQKQFLQSFELPTDVWQTWFTTWNLLKNNEIDTLEHRPNLLKVLTELELYDLLSLLASNSILETSLLEGSHKSPKYLRMLLDIPGYDLSTVDGEGRSLLENALLNGDSDSLERLLDQVDDTIVRKANKTLLSMAMERDELGCLETLLNHPRIDINRSQSSGARPLHLAVSNSNPHCLWLMTQCMSLEIDATDTKGSTALHVAINLKDDFAAQTLLQHGASLKLLDYRSRNALHLAAQSNYTCLKLLLDQPQTEAMQSSDGLGLTPLHYAIASEKPELLSLLLDRGVHVNERDKQGQTLLHFLARGGFYGCAVRLLERSDIEYDVVDNLGRTPLHGACAVTTYERCFEALQRKYGLAQEAYFSVDRDLSFGCESESELIRLLPLLDTQPDLASESQPTSPHSVSRSGQETLHHLLDEADISLSAIEQGAQQCLGVLIRFCNLNMADVLGQTPLHLAAYSSVSAFEILLTEPKVSRNVRDKHGNTVLHVAAEHNDACLSVLASASWIDLNAVNSAGDTALHLAVARNISLFVLETFLRRENLQLEIRNAAGMTPLELAQARGQTANANLLGERIRQVTGVDERAERRGLVLPWIRRSGA